MQTAASNNLILTELSSFMGLAGIPATRHGELYQQIISGLFKQVANKEAVYRLAWNLAQLAYHAYNVRRLDTVGHASQILSTLPEPWKCIGSYYWAKCLRHQGKVSEACAILEQVCENAPLRYRARAVQFLGSIAHTTDKYQTALPFYLEASRIASSGNWCDPHTTVTAKQNIAIIKSIYGDHRAALADLERLFPLVRSLADPYKYYHYLNSLAVEYAEVGRVEEAGNVSRIVLASPYAFAYPEWRETGDEIAWRGYHPSRSVVSFSNRPHNILHLPERTPAPELSTCSPQQPGSITKLEDWKKKMVKQPNGNGEELPENMTGQDMAMKLLELITENKGDDENLRKILEYAVEVFSQKKDQ